MFGRKKKKRYPIAYTVPSAEGERSVMDPLDWSPERSIAIAKSSAEHFSKAQEEKRNNS